MSLRSILEAGLGSDHQQCNYSVAEYCDSLRQEFSLWMQPARYYVSMGEATKLLSEQRRGWLKGVKSSSSNVLRDLAYDGFHLTSQTIKQEHLRSLHEIAKESLRHSINAGRIQDTIFEETGSRYMHWTPSPGRMVEILEILTSYKAIEEVFGTKLLRVDGISFNSNDGRRNNFSTQWHRDGVGSRIKIFIIIASHGSRPSTEILPRSSGDTYHAKNIDMLRCFKELGASVAVQDLVQARLEEYYQSKTLTLNQSAGAISLFNTNAFHRAKLSAVEGYGLRLKLEVELMEPSSSNTNHVLGACAPGRNGFVNQLEPDQTDRLKEYCFDESCFTPNSYGTIDYIVPSQEAR